MQCLYFSLEFVPKLELRELPLEQLSKWLEED